MEVSRSHGGAGGAQASVDRSHLVCTDTTGTESSDHHVDLRSQEVGWTRVGMMEGRAGQRLGLKTSTDDLVKPNGWDWNDSAFGCSYVDAPMEARWYDGGKDWAWRRTISAAA